MRIAIVLLFVASLGAQTIRTARPRVFADSATTLAAAARKTGTADEQALYNALVTYANNYCRTTDPINSSKQGCAEFIAVLYQLDPTTWSSRTTQACQWLNFMVDRDDGDTGGWLDTDDKIQSGNQTRWYIPRVAHTWDILNGVCNEQTKTNVRFMASRAWEIKNMNSTWPQGKWTIFKQPYKVNNNIGVGEFAAMAQLAMAMYDASDYTAPQTTWLPEILTLTRQTVLPCVNNSTAVAPYEACFGGSWQEGTSGYAPETAYFTLDLLDAWRIGTTDVDLWPEVTGGLLRYMADWTFYGLSPTGAAGTYGTLYEPWIYRDVLLGDSQFLWRPWREMFRRLYHQFDRQSDTTYKAYSQYFNKTVMPYMYMHWGNHVGYEFERLFYEDPTSAGTDWRTVIGTNYATPFMALSRSDWTTNATWVGVMAMQEGGDHMHGDAGNFQIYRKGKWLTREIPGYWRMRDVNPNASHNSLTLGWHGTLSGATRGGGVSADTTWPRMVRTTSGYRARCTGTETYCVAELDLGPVYRFGGYNIEPDVSSAKRHWLYLKPDIVVVADRIKYVGAVSLPSTFHVQSEKGAASIDGSRATISNGAQRLHVNVVEPETPTFNAPIMDYCRVMGGRKISDNSADVFLDCGHGVANGTSVTIANATGDWAAINGTWSITIPTTYTAGLGFKDGVAYNGERIRLTGTGLFSGLTTWPIALTGVPTTSLAKVHQWNDPWVNPSSPTTVITQHPYRLDITTGPSNEHGFLVVMEGADSTDTPITVTRRSGSNSFAASFVQDSTTYVVATPSASSVTLPMTYTVPSGSAANYVLGLASSTTYNVSVAAGTVTIAASGAGNDIASSAEGVLYFDSDSASAPLAFASPSSLPEGQVNAAYTSTTLTCTGGTLPYTWDLSSGSLPTGMTLAEATGILSGTPTQSGTFAITARCTDDASATATRAFSLVISVVPLVVTESPLPIGTVGEAYSQAIVAQGGTAPYTWASTGTLPPGITLSSGGTLSGTPTTAGTYSFEACATDSAGSPQTDCGPFAVTVQPVLAALSITTTSLTVPVYDQAYSGEIAGTGGGGADTFEWSISAGSLCGWMAASNGGIQSGYSYVLSGTPNDLTACTFTVRLASGASSTTREFTVTPSRATRVDVRHAVAGGTVAIIRAGWKATEAGENLPQAISALPYDQSCTATVYDASLVEAGSATVAAGAAFRDFIVTGLTSSTAYTAVVTCGYYTSASTSFRTRSAATGTKTITVSSGPHGTATHARLRYGATSGLGSQTDVTSCGSGCTLSITGLTAETPVYVRKVFTDSGGNAIATGAISVHIPR